jgi:3-deoxy-manno-octulosonate cytidylyltransferase (CMP-KDO synthetase)
MRREDRACGDIQRQQGETGAENGTEDLIEFEGIHRGSALAERAAAGETAGPLRRRTNTRFSSSLATRITRPSMADDILILIPARMASTRLPGKPLADIAGLPMIVQVLRRAEAAQLGPVVVACDDEIIATAVEKAGGRAIMTRADHPSGSDRIFEALGIVDPKGRVRIVVNVQGDLPTIAPADIAAALLPLNDPAVDIATLAAEIHKTNERTNPNVVKVVGTLVVPGRLRALYFTRATAPAGDGPLYHHIGLYAYRRTALERFVKLPPSPLEQREKLEQLRAVEAGMRIDVAIVETVPLGVDTPQDLETARAMLR